MLRRIAIRNRGLLRKALSVLLLTMLASLVGANASLAAAKKKDPAACSLSTSAVGDLIASGAGLTSGTHYQYEIYAAPRPASAEDNSPRTHRATSATA
jgi:hypothetical protein